MAVAKCEMTKRLMYNSIGTLIFMVQRYGTLTNVKSGRRYAHVSELIAVRVVTLKYLRSKVPYHVFTT